MKTRRNLKRKLTRVEIANRGAQIYLIENSKLVRRYQKKLSAQIEHVDNEITTLWSLLCRVSNRLDAMRQAQEDNYKSPASIG